MKNWPLRLILAAAAAALVGFGAHVLLGQAIEPVVAKAMQGNEIARPPYGIGITVLAGVTAMIPALMISIIFYFVGEHIPGRHRWMKGLIMGLVVLAVKGQLVREPLMAIAIGNPVWIALLQQLEKWAANVGMCLVIALLAPYRSSRARI